MTPVRLEPAALRSRVKHSTTEPPRSLVCSNDDPKLTLTYLTSKSNLLPNAFKWDSFGKVDFLNTVEAKVIILT